MKRMDLLDNWLTKRFGLYLLQLIEKCAGFHFGTLIAQPSMFEEMRMPYEAIPILIFLTISLLSGLGLIGDALRRAIHDMRREDHDLHAQRGPKLDLAARRPEHSVGRVVAIQEVGGLHHRAERRVA